MGARGFELALDGGGFGGRLREEGQDVASHARAVRHGQRLAFLEERDAVDEHAHVAGVGEEEVDAPDVVRLARLGPVAERDDPLGITARREGGVGVEAVLDASLGRADEGGEGVAALADADEVDHEAVVAAPVLHGRVQVEARPFVESLAPRTALEVEGVLSGGGEGVRHADRAVVGETAGGGLPFDLAFEVEQRDGAVRGGADGQQQGCGDSMFHGVLL